MDMNDKIVGKRSRGREKKIEATRNVQNAPGKT